MSIHMFNGPARARLGSVRGVSVQARHGSISCWAAQPRSSMIILIRVVSGRRHDGPDVPDWTQTCKQKNSKIQKIKGNIQIFLDSIGYTYNFRYIFRKNNFRYT